VGFLFYFFASGGRWGGVRLPVGGVLPRPQSPLRNSCVSRLFPRRAAGVFIYCIGLCLVSVYLLV
jgi:hypothetical protein